MKTLHLFQIQTQSYVQTVLCSYIVLCSSYSYLLKNGNKATLVFFSFLRNFFDYSAIDKREEVTTSANIKQLGSMVHRSGSGQVSLGTELTSHHLSAMPQQRGQAFTCLWVPDLRGFVEGTSQDAVTGGIKLSL